MKRQSNPATDIVERARALYGQQLEAMKAYLGPVPFGVQPMSREQADLKLAQMNPQDIAQLAQTNPVAAEQAAQRLNLMDARAAATPADTFSDIGPND